MIGGRAGTGTWRDKVGRNSYSLMVGGGVGRRDTEGTRVGCMEGL